MTAREHRVVTGCGALHVVDVGPVDGPPVVLLHGLTFDHRAWQRQLGSPLAERLRLIAPDLRGHGRSDGSELADAARWGDDLTAVLDGLGLDGVVLCAWSFATGMVARHLARHGDARLAAVQFVAGVPGPETPGDGWPAIAPGFAADAAADWEPATDALIDALAHAPFQAHERGLWRAMSGQVPGPARRQLLALPPAPAVTTTRPVRFAYGAEDRISSPANLAAGLRRFPHADSVLYPDVGHAPQWEAADRFNRDLAAFVSAVRGDAP